MASYTELYKLAQEDSELRQKVLVACLVAADSIRQESDLTANHANRLLWAKSAFSGPTGIGAQMLVAVLAQNKAFTVPQIKAATDAAIQTAVNACVDLFATGA